MVWGIQRSSPVWLPPHLGRSNLAGIGIVVLGYVSYEVGMALDVSELGSKAVQTA